MIHTRSRKAFTLIELLVVIAIIAILIGLLIPAVQKARDAMMKLRCQNNLHQIGIALNTYHDGNEAFPPGIGYSSYQYLSWLARILPYVEQRNSWDATAAKYAAGITYPWNNVNFPTLGMTMELYNCPMDYRGPQARYLPSDGLTVGFTGYLGNSGTTSAAGDGVLFRDSKIRLIDITDGASTTLMAGERPPSADYEFGWWFAGWGQDGSGSCDVVLGSKEPVVNTFYSNAANGCKSGTVYLFSQGRLTNPCDQYHFWSLHVSGGNFLMADASVQFITYAVGAPILPALSTRKGGEPTPNF
jgi:prepilin-type N-terminal cleavage/methylation domain-containing protein